MPNLDHVQKDPWMPWDMDEPPLNPNDYFPCECGGPCTRPEVQLRHMVKCETPGCDILMHPDHVTATDWGRFCTACIRLHVKCETCGDIVPRRFANVLLVTEPASIGWVCLNCLDCDVEF